MRVLDVDTGRVSEYIPSFKEALRQLINENSLENMSDTPDYVLANYMMDCLNAFNKAVNEREVHATPID